MGKTPVSIIVLTYNEEANIRSCLESLKDFTDEIFLLDSFSTDKTLEIAREYTEKIFQNPFVDWVQQRNWAFNNLPFSYQWIFVLDADEQLTKELCLEISTTLASSIQKYDGYYIKRNFIFLGKWLKYGGNQKDFILRLMKKDKARYVTTSGFREKIVVDGTIGLLTSPMLHEDHKYLGAWIEKQNLRADIDAREIHNKQEKFSNSSLFKKENVEHFYRIWLQEKIWTRLPSLIRPFIKFVYHYFLRLGFLDGKEGFIYWFLIGLWYPLLVDAKCLELSRKSSKSA